MFVEYFKHQCVLNSTYLTFPQFHEAWHKLMEWLEESEKSLDSDLEIANDPDKIKMQLAQHKVSCDC